MKIRSMLQLGIAAATALAVSVPASAYELSIPSLAYRTGPYAPNGIPFADGYADYFALLNERDGGINGVKVNLIECETAYNTKQGVECYESTKNAGDSGALVIQPLSTGITYQLIPKAAVDEIPIFSMGYGRTSVTNGRVFPWVFNFPASYWDQASIFVKYIADREGGIPQLNGKKIALVYHNSSYGKEPIPTLEALSKKHGFEFLSLAVDHPGQEQKATWLQIRREKPDWVLLWGWGVMNAVAIKEAVSIRYPMDRMIGNWWSGSEVDVRPSGKDAHGYLSGGFHSPGADTKLHADIFEHLYDKGKGSAAERSVVGEVLYNRGMIAAVWTVEAIRTAMEIHDTKEVTGVACARRVRGPLCQPGADDRAGPGRFRAVGPDFLHQPHGARRGRHPAMGCQQAEMVLRDRFLHVGPGGHRSVDRRGFGCLRQGAGDHTSRLLILGVSACRAGSDDSALHTLQRQENSGT